MSRGTRTSFDQSHADEGVDFVARAISTKVVQFVAGLAENRFAATYAWWIGLVERFAKPVQLGGRLVDDPYECIARAAINHLYQTGNEISAQFGRVILGLKTVTWSCDRALGTPIEVWCGRLRPAAVLRNRRMGCLL